MKKFLTAAGICLGVFPFCSCAQQTGNALAAGPIKSAWHKNQYLNDINTRAMRDFMNRFDDVTNESWHKTNDMYVAVFIRDSIQYRVMYTQRGDYCYLMKYYEESKMSRDIRGQVKSVYYDYKIFIVQEIETPNQPTVYIISLKGDNDWKKVRLCAGELEVMDVFKKGK